MSGEIVVHTECDREIQKEMWRVIYRTLRFAEDCFTVTDISDSHTNSYDAIQRIVERRRALVLLSGRKQAWVVSKSGLSGQQLAELRALLRCKRPDLCRK